MQTVSFAEEQGEESWWVGVPGQLVSAAAVAAEED